MSGGFQFSPPSVMFGIYYMIPILYIQLDSGNAHNLDTKCSPPLCTYYWVTDAPRRNLPAIDGFAGCNNRCLLRGLSVMRESASRPYFFSFAPVFLSVPFSDLLGVPFFPSLPPSSLVMTSTS